VIMWLFFWASTPTDYEECWVILI